MNVLIGDVINPATMWVAPVAPDIRTTPIKDMERNLSYDCQSGSLLDDPPDVSLDLRVAVKSSRRAALWQRGKITSVDYTAGPTFSRNDRVTVDVFLVDVGKELKNVDVATRIRSLPDHFNELEDTAFVVRLDGLMPICKSVDYSKKGKFRNTISRTWNEHCLHMVFALIKVGDGATFYDSEVDLDVQIKGGYPIRVGKIVLELPLLIKPKLQERLKPYTSNITAGMWLQGERRLLNLNECLLENNFAIKVDNKRIFDIGESVKRKWTLLDEKKWQKADFSYTNTGCSDEGEANRGARGYEVRDFWGQEMFSEEGCLDAVEREANRQQMEDRIKRLLDDIDCHHIDRNEGDETSRTTLSSGYNDEDSFVIDSDGERFYNCKEELD